MIFKSKFEILIFIIIEITLLSKTAKSEQVKCSNSFGKNKLNGTCSLIDVCQGAALIANLDCSPKEICCLADKNSTSTNQFISKEIFLKVTGNTSRNDWLYGHFSDSLDAAEINTEYRASAYLSQLLGETDFFRLIESDKPENDIENEGSIYRGRGAILLRGKSNYELASNSSLGINFYNNPEMAAFPSNAFKLAAWFWKQNAYVIKSLNPAKKESLNNLVDSSFFSYTMLTHSLTNNLQSLKQRANLNEQILNMLNSSNKMKRGQGIGCSFKNGNRNLSGLAVPICLADFKKPYCGCPNKYDPQSCPYGKTSDNKCRNSAIVKCCEEACNTYLDLVILIDSSGSIDAGDFEILKDFVRNLIKRLPISQDETRVALISFNTNAKILIDLNNGTSFQILNETINILDNKAGGDTYTDRALKIANEDILNEMNGMRSINKAVPKVVIVITDGESNKRNETIFEANRIKERGINVISIGIGKANPQELNSIASTPNDQYYVSDFSKIFEILAVQSITVCYQPAQIPCKLEIDSQVEKDSYKYFKLSLRAQNTNASNRAFINEFTFKLTILSGNVGFFYSFEDQNPKSPSDYLSNDNGTDENFVEKIFKIYKRNSILKSENEILYPVKSENDNEFVYFSIKGADEKNQFKIYVFEEYINQEDDKYLSTNIIIAIVVGVVLLVVISIGLVFGIRIYKRKNGSSNETKNEMPVLEILDEKYIVENSLKTIKKA